MKQSTRGPLQDTQRNDILIEQWPNLIAKMKQILNKITKGILGKEEVMSLKKHTRIKSEPFEEDLHKPNKEFEAWKTQQEN